MPPKAKKRGGHKGAKKAPADKEQGKASQNGTAVGAKDYPERYLRGKLAAALLTQGNGGSETPSPTRAKNGGQPKCHAKACKESDLAKLCCLVCSRAYDLEALGVVSIVHTGADCSSCSEDAVDEATPVLEVDVSVAAVANELRTWFASEEQGSGAEEAAGAKGGEGGADGDSASTVDDLESMGITKEPVLAAVYGELDDTERVKFGMKLAPKYPTKPITGTDDVFNYTAILEHLEGHVGFQPPSVMMSPEHFPYVTRYPSIKNYIGILTQLGEEALIWNSVNTDDTPYLATPTIALGQDGKKLSCLVYGPKKESEVSSPQTPSSAADAALPETVEQALRWFAHIGDPSGNDDAVALPTSEKLEQYHRGFTISCMRVTFFKHAIEMAAALEDDIRATDSDLVGAFSLAQEDLGGDSGVRQTVSQLLRSEAVCEYVSQALKQQLSDVAEKIAQARKLRESIDSILQRKGNARMDLERKIMAAGKRASEAAVQRAFQRHIEDMKEEQPLQDQKKDSEIELKERMAYETSLKEELIELEHVRLKLVESREGLHESVQQDQATATTLTRAESAEARVQAARAPIGLLLDITTRKRFEWAARQSEWARVKGVLGQRLRGAMVREDPVRDAVFRVAREALAAEMHSVIGADKARVERETLAAAEQALRWEAELVESEDIKAKKRAARDAKARAREEKRLLDDLRRREQEQAEAEKRRAEEREEEARKRREEQARDDERRRLEEAREAAIRTEAAKEFEREQEEEALFAAVSRRAAETSKAARAATPTGNGGAAWGAGKAAPRDKGHGKGGSAGGAARSGGNGGEKPQRQRDAAAGGNGGATRARSATPETAKSSSAWSEAASSKASRKSPVPEKPVVAAASHGAENGAAGASANGNSATQKSELRATPSKAAEASAATTHEAPRPSKSKQTSPQQHQQPPQNSDKAKKTAVRGESNGKVDSEPKKPAKKKPGVASSSSGPNGSNGAAEPSRPPSVVLPTDMTPAPQKEDPQSNVVIDIAFGSMSSIRVTVPSNLSTASDDVVVNVETAVAPAEEEPNEASASVEADAVKDPQPELAGTPSGREPQNEEEDADTASNDSEQGGADNVSPTRPASDMEDGSGGNPKGQAFAPQQPFFPGVPGPHNAGGQHPYGMYNPGGMAYYGPPYGFPPNGYFPQMQQFAPFMHGGAQHPHHPGQHPHPHQQPPQHHGAAENGGQVPPQPPHEHNHNSRSFGPGRGKKTKNQKLRNHKGPHPGNQGRPFPDRAEGGPVQGFYPPPMSPEHQFMMHQQMMMMQSQQFYPDGVPYGMNYGMVPPGAGVGGEQPPAQPAPTPDPPALQ